MCVIDMCHWSHFFPLSGNDALYKTAHAMPGYATSKQ